MAFYLKQKVIAPLKIGKFVHFFDETGNPVYAVDEYEQIIRSFGGIDVVSHGIGVNGHIGFNEPGSSWDSCSRIVKLAQTTLDSNFCGEDALLQRKHAMGITLGLDLLTKAQMAFLLIAGKGKEEIARRFFQEQPSLNIPATSLVLNPVAGIVCDTRSVFAHTHSIQGISKCQM